MMNLSDLAFSLASVGEPDFHGVSLQANLKVHPVRCVLVGVYQCRLDLHVLREAAKSSLIVARQLMPLYSSPLLLTLCIPV